MKMMMMCRRAFLEDGDDDDSVKGLCVQRTSDALFGIRSAAVSGHLI